MMQLMFSRFQEAQIIEYFYLIFKVNFYTFLV